LWMVDSFPGCNESAVPDFGSPLAVLAKFILASLFRHIESWIADKCKLRCWPKYGAVLGSEKPWLRSSSFAFLITYLFKESGYLFWVDMLALRWMRRTESIGCIFQNEYI
jgi:hypothetical protein